MQTLPRATGKVLDALTADLAVGEARVLDTTGGVYLPVHVDRLTARLFAVAHYITQNGDRVCDPDGVFLQTETGWLPVSLQLCTGHYTEAIELDADDQPTGYRPRALRELRSFAVMWLRNIGEQQGDIVHIQQAITQ